MTVMLNDKVFDPVTQTRGTCTARTEYLGGSTRCFIETDERSEDGKVLEGQWIEEDRLEYQQ